MMRRFRERHPDRVKAQAKKTYQRVLMEVLYRYSFGGLECECCGWSQVDGPNHLELDHVGGGGSWASRYEGDRGISLLRRALREFHPEEFRVLCRACNAIIEPNQSHCVLHRDPSAKE